MTGIQLLKPDSTGNHDPKVAIAALDAMVEEESNFDLGIVNGFLHIPDFAPGYDAIFGPYSKISLPIVSSIDEVTEHLKFPNLIDYFKFANYLFDNKSNLKESKNVNILRNDFQKVIEHHKILTNSYVSLLKDKFNCEMKHYYANQKDFVRFQGLFVGVEETFGAINSEIQEAFELCYSEELTSGKVFESLTWLSNTGDIIIKPMHIGEKKGTINPICIYKEENALYIDMSEAPKEAVVQNYEAIVK